MSSYRILLPAYEHKMLIIAYYCPGWKVDMFGLENLTLTMAMQLDTKMFYISEVMINVESFDTTRGFHL